MALAGALAGYATLRAGAFLPLVAPLGLLGFVLVLFALTGMIALLPWGLALLAVDYVLVDLVRGLPLLAAPFYGTGLLLVAELTYATRELRRGHEEQLRRRLAWLVAIAAAALAVAFLPIVAAGIHGPTGLAAEIITLLAAIGLLSIPTLLARR